MCAKVGRKPLKEKGLAGLHIMYSYYKRNARVKNVRFNLTREEFINIVKQNCIYCGAVPSGIVKNNTRGTTTETKDFGAALVNGIDRIDSSVGYETNNVQPCCKKCNYMKWTLTEKEFLDHAKAITAHTRTKART